MVEASTTPCALISTTTTLVRVLPLASLTRPVIVTVVRGGLSIFSTGEASRAGAGVDSGVADGEGSGVGAAPDGAGVDEDFGSGVASGVGEGGDGVGEVGDDSGTDTAGASDEGDAAGVGTGAAGDGDSVAGCEIATGASATGDEAGLAEASAAGVKLGAAAGELFSVALWPAGICAVTGTPAAGPIFSSSPSSEPLTLR